MGQALAFDTLAHANKLRKAGFTQKQAEAQAEAIAELIEQQLASKHDLALLQKELMTAMKELELRLTIRLGALIAVAVGVVATLVKIL